MEPYFTVHLLDDDRWHAHALAARLEAEGRASRVHASVEEFFGLAHEAALGCVIVEASVAGRSGLDVLDAIADSGLPFPVVFLVSEGDLGTCVRAMRRGAIDYLTKPVAIDELRQALRRAEALSRAWQGARMERTLALQRLSRLSPREREILELVLAGRRNKQIAAELDSREATVKVHRSRLMRKLEARSLAEVLRLAAHLREVAMPLPAAARSADRAAPPGFAGASHDLDLASALPGDHRH